MFHTILFDLDGTLTDSREGIVNSVKYTIEKLGGTMPDAQTLLKFIGPPLQESFMEHCGYSGRRRWRAFGCSGSTMCRWDSMKTRRPPVFGTFWNG